MQLNNGSCGREIEQVANGCAFLGHISMKLSVNVLPSPVAACPVREAAGVNAGNYNQAMIRKGDRTLRQCLQQTKSRFDSPRLIAVDSGLYDY